jgi:hypothetical protein
VKTNRLKLVAAAAGGCAVVAMITLTGLTHTGPANGRMISEPKMTTGETSTAKKAAPSPETSVATPPFTYTTPSGFAEPH